MDYQVLKLIRSVCLTVSRPGEVETGLDENLNFNLSVRDSPFILEKESQFISFSLSDGELGEHHPNTVLEIIGVLTHIQKRGLTISIVRVHELCESRGGRPGLSVLMSLTVSVDVKQH